MPEEKDKQIKSKERVAKHGEVYTNEREVNAMLDLVKNETERIDSRFLEPACGNGNFLVKILERKLNIVTNKYKKKQTDWEFYSLFALSSIYGIDILEDNCEECRLRLLEIYNNTYISFFHNKIKQECLVIAKYLLEKNIICGDALNLKTSENKDIAFAEWSFVYPDKVKRIDYTMRNLISAEPNTLFPNAEAVQEFPLTNFLKIQKEYENN